MKQYLYLFIAVILLTACSSKTGKPSDNRDAAQSSEESTTSNEDKNNLSTQEGDRAVCNMPWGITNDAYSSILDKWTNKNRQKDGFIHFSEFKVKSDGISAEFDKNGHLTTVKMELQEIKIYPQNDYADEEKAQLKKMLEDENGKIGKLIKTLSDIYGQPIDNVFDGENTDMFFTTSTVTLCQWKTNGTNASLKAINSGNFSTMGCNTRLIIMTTQNK